MERNRISLCVSSLRNRRSNKGFVVLGLLAMAAASALFPLVGLVTAVAIIVGIQLGIIATVAGLDLRKMSAGEIDKSSTD